MAATPSRMAAHYKDPDFPAAALFDWFGGMTREVSAIPPQMGRMRFRWFPTHELFREFLVHCAPVQVDLGACFKIRPVKSEFQTADNPVVGKQLVFDIDLDNYKQRTCCGAEKKQCGECWKFARIGWRILVFLLEREFGFKHFLPIFSGRRGVHLWVLDLEAFSLTDAQRKAVLDRVSLNMALIMKNPNAMDAYTELILPFFQREFAARAPCACRDQQVHMRHVLEYVWPRLDRKVTIETTHLTRMPLSIRDDTGAVCWVLSEYRDDPINHPEEFVLKQNAGLFVSIVKRSLNT